MINLFLFAMLFIPLIASAQAPAENHYTCAPPDCQPDPEFIYRLPAGAWWTETRLTTDTGAIVILRPMANCTGPAADFFYCAFESWEGAAPHTVRVYRSLEHARPIARAEIVWR